MISAEEFLRLLEEKDLVPGELIEDLRDKIARSNVPTNAPPWNKPVTAARLAKWLVDNGHLSRLLAQRLLAKAEQPPEAAGPSRPERSKLEKLQKPPPAEEEELGFAPLPEDEVKKKTGPPATPARPAKPPPPSKPPSTGPEPPPAVETGGSLLDEELPVMGGGGLPGIESLDELPEGSLLEADAAAGSPLSPAVRKKAGLFAIFRRTAKLGKARKKENVWDSTLLLVGGGALLSLVILGGVLIWAFTRQSADEMLAVADDFYQQGSYTNAIQNYNRYLEEFPKHSGVSLARVRRGLSQLRQATGATSDWSGALGTAKGILQEISSEKEFGSEARPELAALLPKIAEGLAGQARDELDPALVAESREALKLVDKYIPRSLQPVTRLAKVKTLLAFTEREIACGDQRDEAVAAMFEAVKQGDTQKAYEIRNELLRQYPPERYPQLAHDEKLKKAMLAVSQAQQASVKMVSKEQAAEKGEAAGVMVATVALADCRMETEAPGAEGHVVFVLAEGAAYGLDAATGKVLWRRPVGFAVGGRSPSFPPTPISKKAGSDAVLVDTRRNEVLRVDAATGGLRWRHPVGERFDAHPVVVDDQLLVATRSGRLVLIDLETGNSAGYLQLPQSLRVSPVVDPRLSRAYQVAEHSNLYVLSLADGTAEQVVYLEHGPGSITAAPVLISRFLIVAENDGMEDGRLRVLSVESAGEGPSVRPVQEVRLNGHVDTPPLVFGLRLLVTTDQGDVYVFQVSGSNAEAPLEKVADGKAAGEGLVTDDQDSVGPIRFPLMVSGQVWIADSQLTRYDIQPQFGRLQPKGIVNEGSVSLARLVTAGEAIFHVRRMVGLPGVVVSACTIDDARPLWETRLASPLASEPIIDAEAGKITAVTSTGALFQVDVTELQGQAVVCKPEAALPPIEVRQPLTDVVQLDRGLLALATVDGPSQIPVIDTREAKKRFRWLALPEALDCRPIAFAGGLLAPCKAGQVLLLDPRSGRQQVEPFQPRLESGAEVTWREPAVVGDDQIVLADNRNRLYRVGIQKKPKPHLDALAEPVNLTESVVSPVAVLETVAYAVDAAQTLLAVELPELTRGRPQPLSGRCVWGPRQVGDHVMLATADDRLYCLDGQQKLLWEIDLPYGPLAGAPVKSGDDYILAAAGGVIWRVRAATGEETAKTETGCPLGTGPVLLDDRILVSGHDGSLYLVEQP